MNFNKKLLCQVLSIQEMVLHLQIRTVFNLMGAMGQKMSISSSLWSSLFYILYKMSLSCSWASIPFTTKANYCIYALVLGWNLLYNMKVILHYSYQLDKSTTTHKCVKNMYKIWLQYMYRLHTSCGVTAANANLSVLQPLSWLQLLTYFET
jgi:hypothetical protein